MLEAALAVQTREITAPEQRERVVVALHQHRPASQALQILVAGVVAAATTADLETVALVDQGSSLSKCQAPHTLHSQAA
jgi:hypothetical protein